MARRNTTYAILREFIPSRARFYCETCGGRTFPNDMLDRRTESPEPGKRGAPVLLRTWNHSNPEDQYGYCFACRAMRRVKRLDPKDVLALYIQRKGVVIRS